MLAIFPISISTQERLCQADVLGYEFSWIETKRELKSLSTAF